MEDLWAAAESANRSRHRLRVEADDGDHDVRLPFSAPAEDPEQLRAQVGLLVGCSFRGAH